MFIQDFKTRSNISKVTANKIRLKRVKTNPFKRRAALEKTTKKNKLKAHFTIKHHQPKMVNKSEHLSHLRKKKQRPAELLKTQANTIQEAKHAKQMLTPQKKTSRTD